jgi:hypothetical protein
VSDDKKPKPVVRPGSYTTKPAPIINMDALKARGQALRPRRPAAKIPKAAGILLLACLIFGFGGGFLGAWVQNHGRTALATSTAAKQQYISNESELIESITCRFWAGPAIPARRI